MSDAVMFVLIVIAPVFTIILVGVYSFGVDAGQAEKDRHRRRSLVGKMANPPSAKMESSGRTAHVLLHAPLLDTPLSEKETDQLISQLTEAKLQMKSVSILLELDQHIRPTLPTDAK